MKQGTLHINGLILESTEEDNEEELQFYKDWHNMTMLMTGRLDYPEVEEKDEVITSKVKVSRVDQVLEEYFHEKPLETPQIKQRPPPIQITPE